MRSAGHAGWPGIATAELVDVCWSGCYPVVGMVSRRSSGAALLALAEISPSPLVPIIGVPFAAVYLSALQVFWQ